MSILSWLKNFRGSVESEEKSRLEKLDLPFEDRDVEFYCRYEWLPSVVTAMEDGSRDAFSLTEEGWIKQSPAELSHQAGLISREDFYGWLQGYGHVYDKAEERKLFLEEAARIRAEFDANTKENSFIDSFGCSSCHKLPAIGTKFEDLPFRKIKTLYDSSNNSFWLSECKYCKQPYLEKFYDEIDWSGNGDDPMWSYWMPLKPDEYTLIEQGNSVNTDDLESFLQKRICLKLNPKGGYSWINAN